MSLFNDCMSVCQSDVTLLKAVQTGNRVWIIIYISRKLDLLQSKSIESVRPRSGQLCLSSQVLHWPLNNGVSRIFAAELALKSQSRLVRTLPELETPSHSDAISMRIVHHWASCLGLTCIFQVVLSFLISSACAECTSHHSGAKLSPSRLVPS